MTVELRQTALREKIYAQLMKVAFPKSGPECEITRAFPSATCDRAAAYPGMNRGCQNFPPKVDKSRVATNPVDAGVLAIPETHSETGKCNRS
jgi:hypothetical protein